MYVEVAVNLPAVGGTFHYHLPKDLEASPSPGHLVTVPFGNRRVQGVIIGLSESAPVPKTKPIEALVDPHPVLAPTQLELAQWLAQYCRAPLIDCLTIMLPPGLSQQADSEYRLSDDEDNTQNRTEARLLSLLRRRGPLRGRQIARAMSRSPWRQAADRLVRRGILVRRSVLDPPQVKPRRVRTLRLGVTPEDARAALDRVGHTAATRKRRRKILELLIQEAEPLEVSWVYAETGGNLRDLTYLEKMGLLTLSEAEVWRDPLEQLEFVPKQSPRLTDDQRRAWEAIAAGSVRREGSAFLLHGVTGSGKTEIYLRAVEDALGRERTAIVLVPEIALTPQTVRRFVTRFPGQVGIIHSQLSSGERFDTWRRARRGLLKVIVGPRSALFAPLPQIGLIVVDECHDDSYKETGRDPRYHARDAALAYGRILGAVCLLGSATPDVVTRYEAGRGGLGYLSLPQRILGHRDRLQRQAARLGVTSRYRPVEREAETIDLPPVRIVDMRQELRAGNTSILSRALQESLSQVLDDGQQAILLLNRRGAATHIFCRDCGWVARCPRCERPLVQHGSGQLLCHHCGYSRGAVAQCPQCRGERVRHFGAGTQRLQEEVEARWPNATTLRWDQDTTRAKGSHEVIMAHFAARRADVLIGTQMVAKGLDLPLVTLVGVASADTGLHLPDYRATERSFQLLTQVAGRAGRGLLGGKVIIQTYHPDHYAVRAAASHDYQAFYQRELAERRRLGYPPFSHLVQFLYRSTSAQQAQAEAERLAASLQASIRRQSPAASIIGPVPCYFQKLRGEYRWQVILRSPDPDPFIPESLGAGWTMDVDPVSLL